ncbi:MAG: glutaredoxin domain-containing protein [Sandaracinaceae bacterium]
MQRHILTHDDVHPEIRERIGGLHRDLVDTVKDAIEANPVVVVGMAQNPHVRRARKRLAERGVPFAYLEYGSYLSQWRRRTALKMWTGWPTFPMVFVRGTFIGGADELETRLAAGDLDDLAPS